jgi:hypothetical protein
MKLAEALMRIYVGRDNLASAPADVRQPQLV